MKQNEEWELIGELGEKIVALASKYQELKLALVHRDMQRMSDDNNAEIAFTKEKVESLREAWTKADMEDWKAFTWEGREFDINYARYLLEYLDLRFGVEA